MLASFCQNLYFCSKQEKDIMQLPESFTEYTRTLLGEEEYTRLSTALLGEEQPVSIRLNPQKWDNSSFFILHSSLKEVPWTWTSV